MKQWQIRCRVYILGIQVAHASFLAKPQTHRQHILRKWGEQLSSFHLDSETSHGAADFAQENRTLQMDQNTLRNTSLSFCCRNLNAKICKWISLKTINNSYSFLLEKYKHAYQMGTLRNPFGKIFLLWLCNETKQI